MRRSLLLCASGLAWACSSPPPDAAPPTATDAVTSTGGVLVDELGRELLLRGLNARVEGVFDVTFDDGRIALETIPVFSGADCALIAEELGMNHLRLPVSWSAIEPERGVYQDAYVDRILALAAECNVHGVATLVDLHQDAYSKHIGEDGAPLWAIVPPPTELLEGPLLDLEARRTSKQVLDAFDSFFNDAEGVQTAYADMAAWLAGRIAGQPGIIGLELMNEPVVIVFEQRLDTFHERVGQATRQVAPELTVFFEPNSLRNLTDTADVRTPLGLKDIVYSPHLYVDVFEDGWASEDEGKIAASLEAAIAEAKEHSAALYIGEFGHGPDPRGLKYVRACIDLFDKHAVSSAWWLYEEVSQGSWGLYDAPTEGEARGALREAVADELARPYPAAIAGKLEGFAFDATSRTLTVQIDGASAELSHTIAIPRRVYPAGVSILCDGDAVEGEPSPGRVELVCAGSTIEISPLP